MFNILMGNTDDDERNHSLRLAFDGYHELTPAQSSLDNALTELSEFGIKRPRAIELVRQVARVVDGWEAHFARLGVCAADLALLRASIDRDALRLQRQAHG